MELKILCVPGIGNHPRGGSWEGEWRNAIGESLAMLDADVVPVVEFVHLDGIFARYPITARDVLEALVKLGKSGAASLLREPQALGDQIRWTAGMVVQWVENEALRNDTRQQLEQMMKDFKPHIVCGHSLGSLICYDSFSGSGAALIKNRRLVSCGSQIGNPFVVGNFAAGHLAALPQAEFWYHLYNAEDDVFTAPIRLPAQNFAQIDTFFDIRGAADHDVTRYLLHRRTLETVWSDAVMELHDMPLKRALPAKPVAAFQKPNKRALLVGINQYPDPAHNLEGCVNDVFLMSALLQESGFAAEDIRIVLDHRATHQGVCERLEWLLDGARDDDVRLFYYSGHGTQFPGYGVGDAIDRLDEALVLHDFDWSRERAFTDDDFYPLYSQLPYGLQFIAMFDCCHSGGMTRGAVRKVRGIDPPDDIRHRMLCWNSERDMWDEREIASPNPGFDRKFNTAKTAKKAPHFTHRLGQAMDLRPRSPTEMKRTAEQRSHRGPYMPALIYASREEELSFEYQHGPISYGAFTYCLVRSLRRDRRLQKPQATFESLIPDVGEELADLGYDQRPVLIAPTRIRKQDIPWY